MRRSAVSASLVFAGLLTCMVGPAPASEWSFASRFNTGPDVRWWTGSSATATNGLQIVTNYGGELKLKQQDLFAISGSIDSGYLHAQSKQIIPVVPWGDGSGGPSRNNQANNIADIWKYSAGGPLDIYMSGRIDLLINPVVQPYFVYGYNASQKPTLTNSEVFAFSSDGDRDLRTAFGSGNFYEIRAGSVFNITKNIAADVSWKRNYGTRYMPYSYRSDISYNDGNEAITARLQYADDNFTGSIEFQNTRFFESGSYYSDTGGLGGGIPPPPDILERWIYGDLRVWNAKTEYRFDDHWFAYAEATYSREKNNQYAPPYGPFLLIQTPTPFTVENPNANPIKYSGVVGFGYFINPWTFQIQGLKSVDLWNHFPRYYGAPGAGLMQRFLPTRNRVGAEAIISFRASNFGSLVARVGYLHVNGLEGVPQSLEYATVPPYEPAQIWTVYLTANLTWEPR
jgi:hypothetical protein